MLELFETTNTQAKHHTEKTAVIIYPGNCEVNTYSCQITQADHLTPDRHDQSRCGLWLRPT